MGDHLIEFHNISILISKSKLWVLLTCGYSMRKLASSSNSALVVNFSLSTAEASDSTLDYIQRLNYRGMLQLFQRRGESDQPGGKLCSGCDKKQLVLMTVMSSKQVVTSVNMRRRWGATDMRNLQVVEGEMQEGKSKLKTRFLQHGYVTSQLCTCAQWTNTIRTNKKATSEQSIIPHLPTFLLLIRERSYRTSLASALFP